MSAKEKIDKIKKCLIAGYDIDIITQEEMGILWNYITNLQTIEQQYSAILSENAELENKITNLQEENERLKEINKINNDEDYIYTYEELQDKVLKLQKKYNDLSKKLWGEVDDRIECKSRIDKAIEYIEERKNLNWYADGVFVYELLNILNGGDE